jgi:hypothetical protein
MELSDVDALLNYVLPQAQTLLKKNGEFYPLAAYIKPDGELTPFAICDGNEHPAPTQMIADLKSLLRDLAKQGEVRAVAICYDGRVKLPGKEKQDAITAFIEEQAGQSMTIYLPYSKKLLRGYQFDELTGVEADSQIFA